MNIGDCVDPGVPDNGRQLDTSYKFGDIVRFECDPGFELIGVAAIQCILGPDVDTQDVIWSTSIPSCYRKSVAPPPPPPTGDLSHSISLILFMLAYRFMIISIMGKLEKYKLLRTYPDNSPPGQFPTAHCIGPDECFYWLFVVLMGSCPRRQLP